MTSVLLIRHAENDYTSQGRLAGWIPGVHLNEKGKQQAAALAEQLATEPIKAIYSSPLLRALETAKPLAKTQGLPIDRCAGVAEVRYGAWQGQKLHNLQRRKLWKKVQQRPSAAAFPKGEALRKVQSRAVDAIETICARHPKDMVAVFSHGDVIKMILAQYLGMPLDLYQRIEIGTASISHLIVTSGTPRLLGVNDVADHETVRGKWDQTST